MGNTLAYLSYWEDFKLLVSLQILEIPFHSFDDASAGDNDISEEKLLEEILNQRTMPNLKEVQVPSRPDQREETKQRLGLLCLKAVVAEKGKIGEAFALQEWSGQAECSGKRSE